MRRSAVFLVLATVAAFLAAVVVFSALRKRDNEMRAAIASQVKIVVAATEIPIGARIKHSMVKLVGWASDSVPGGSFRQLAAVENSYALTQLFPGEPVLSQRIVSRKGADAIMPLMIPGGMRAMSVPVDAVSDIAGFVQPHTRVDVLVALSGNGPGQKPFAKIVLQDVRVLAVAQEINPRKGGAKIVKVVTLLVSPHQAEKLALASREGTLRLVMRGYDDTKIVNTSGVDIADLLGRSAMGSVMPAQSTGASGLDANPRVRRRGYSVEIMRNGKRSQTVSFIHGKIRLSQTIPARTASYADRRGAAAAVRQALADNRGSASTASAGAGYLPQIKAIQIP